MDTVKQKAMSEPTGSDPLKEWYDYLVRQQNKIEEVVRFYVKESNLVFREISKQLTFVSTVLITFTSPIFLQLKLISDLSRIEKNILLFFWLTLVLSIVAGIIQFFVDNKFFEVLAEKHNNVVKNIASGQIAPYDYSGLELMVAKELSSLKTKSNIIPFVLQTFLFFSSLGIFFIFLENLLNK